ncbi:transposable element Tcb2 transposase [Histoplasma capsulatum G186AR]|uniref:Transposable element Tcb2 transposase n=1 Tax=Ajellomyces capsulatus (strain G186AR / H82 / ATCC MYA-2454 / RMSCC 2432) TaxID=447093 RepID=C0NDM3_AJECG|nr:transposable element Tcb2 transposase [Histoplasma capsulatum G186AR]EEH10321.1 transposable element Tcb2 transposase [Histoplasma capsulatum G186AR]
MKLTLRLDWIYQAAIFIVQLVKVMRVDIYSLPSNLGVSQQ